MQRAVGVRGWRLTRLGRHREAKATDLILHRRDHLPRALRLLTHATHSLDAPLNRRVEERLEDALVLAAMVERAVALADLLTVACRRG
eukprot:1144558-Prymnesium_polylepis.1